MLLAGGSVYHDKELLSQKTHVCFSDSDGMNFSTLIPIELEDDVESDFDWLWRVTWFGEHAYGVLYQKDQRNTALVRTNDGVHYEHLTRFDFAGRPNEATIRFLSDGTMAIMHRREEDDQMGYWGTSRAPFVNWEWQPMDLRLGGPDFCVLDDGKIVVGTRIYQSSGHYVGILLGNRKGVFREIFKLPSGGDCSYPGFVVEEDRILMSYYASHEGQAKIYLAKIRKNLLPDK